MLRIILLIALGILISVAVYQTVRIMRLISTGHELANSAVAYEQHPANPTARLLVIGDSSAVGVGASKPEESLEGRLGARYPTLDITNRGVNGSKVKNLLTDFSPPPDEHYDYLLIHIGGNDVTRLTNLDELEKNLPPVLDRATKVADKVLLLSGGNFVTVPLFPWPTNYYWAERSKRVRDLFDRIAKEKNVVYIDLYQSNKADLAEENYELDYAGDGFHLSSRGYEGWYRGVTKTLEENAIDLSRP